MFNKILRITLAVFVLTYFVSSVYASDSESSGHGPHDKLNRAIRNEGNAEREAQKQFDTLQDVNRLVGDLGIAYSAKSEAIAKGKTVTIAAGVGAIGSAVLTGGVTAPTVTGIIGAALSLGMSWKGYDNLLYRYNEALELKVSQIEKTKNAIDTYDEVYNDQYLVERSNHLNAVTTHNQYHHKPPITKWSRTPDYSLPSFRCGGDCRQSFSTPLGDHGEVCGQGSEVPGCHKVWYSCVSADVRKHSPIRCTLDYKVYRKLPNHKKELFVTKTCPDQFRPCMTFDLGYHEEVHYGSLDSWENSDTIDITAGTRSSMGNRKSTNMTPTLPYVRIRPSICLFRRQRPLTTPAVFMRHLNLVTILG